METLLTDDILDRMRKIGDPRVDTAVARVDDEARRKLIKGARKDGLAFLKDDWLTDNAAVYGVDGLLNDPGTLPDPDLVKTACDLFARYGSEIAAALLLAALPEAYAAGEGARVLAQYSQLIEGGTLSTRRILNTGQFVIWVLTPGTEDPPVSKDMSKYMSEYTYQSFDDTSRLWGASDGQALRASLALRIMHSFIRFSKPNNQSPAGDKHQGVLLNQEDLLATLLSFSITVFEVLEQFGISWTAEEQEAYFYVWDRVGETLGIGDTAIILALTGTGSLEKLKQKLRRFDEGEPPENPDVGKGDKGEAVGSTPGCHVTREDISELFIDPINRRVLRHVADVGTLRPQSVPVARALLARLRERMWALRNDSFPQRKPFDYENFKQILEDVSPGRILLKALVDEVAAQLPACQKTWPVAVIRQLVPAEVQNRLALGGTSSIGFLTGILGTPRDSPGSAVLRQITAGFLRHRATRVANSLFLYYYDQGLLTIPGLRSTAVGYGVPGLPRTGA
jgi:ER-bound oxygenase mpaB/B'/Rubber oxygenase, catalytic domain